MRCDHAHGDDQGVGCADAHAAFGAKAERAGDGETARLAHRSINGDLEAQVEVTRLLIEAYSRSREWRGLDWDRVSNAMQAVLARARAAAVFPSELRLAIARSAQSKSPGHR